MSKTEQTEQTGKVTIELLTEIDESPIVVQINGDIKLTIDDVDDELVISADYPEDRYTEDEVQKIGSEFMEGLIAKVEELTDEEVEELKSKNEES